MTMRILTGLALSLVVTLGQLQAAQAQKSKARETARSEISAQVDDGSTEWDPRSFKLRASPLVIGSGGISVDASTRIGDGPFTFGLVGEHLQKNELGTQFGFNGIGVTSSYFFRGSPFEHSWYLTPRLLYRTGKITLEPSSLLSSTDTTASADFDIYSLEALFGFQWHWTNFNLTIGAGPVYHMLTVKNVRGKFRNGMFGDSEYSSSGSSSVSFMSLNLDLAVGWSF